MNTGHDSTSPLYAQVETALASDIVAAILPLDKRVVTASKMVAQQLCVPVGAQVYRIERVRLADGVAMPFDETYLPLEIGEKIASNDLETEPIFALLEDKYDLPLIEAQYQLEAVTANEHIAQALDIEVGSPIFLIEWTSYAEALSLPD